IMSPDTNISIVSPLTLPGALPISRYSDHHQWRHRQPCGGEAASRPCRWRDAGAGGLSGAMAFTRRRSGIVRRGGAIYHHEGRLRSEEHTSELQSRFDLVCLLLLEK